jgi:hypothetical protein
MPRIALLKALAEGQIPGIPWNLRMLLLGQTTMASSNIHNDGASDNANQTVLDRVVRSNEKRLRALREAERAYIHLRSFHLNAYPSLSSVVRVVYCT